MRIVLLIVTALVWAVLLKLEEWVCDLFNDES